jgi:dUTP pyrophosphatase
VPHGERRLVSTGVSATPPPGTYIRIAPRSGLSLKDGIDIAGGVVDAGYKGEIKVIMVNASDRDFHVRREMAIAQLIVEVCISDLTIRWRSCPSCQMRVSAVYVASGPRTSPPLDATG